jgi:hypothetical protein
LIKSHREKNCIFKIDFPYVVQLAAMKKLSKRTLAQFNRSNMKKYLEKRKSLVDWLSGVGESLRISNKAIHHSVIVLDLYAARRGDKEFDVHMIAL